MCALVHYMRLLVKCRITAYGMRKMKCGMVRNGTKGNMLNAESC